MEIETSFKLSNFTHFMKTVFGVDKPGASSIIIEGFACNGNYSKAMHYASKILNNRRGVTRFKFNVNSDGDVTCIIVLRPILFGGNPQPAAIPYKCNSIW